MPKYVIGSAVMLLLLFICALFAPYLAPFDPHAVDVASKLMPPSQQHLLELTNWEEMCCRACYMGLGIPCFWRLLLVC